MALLIACISKIRHNITNCIRFQWKYRFSYFSYCNQTKFKHGTSNMLIKWMQIRRNQSVWQLFRLKMVLTQYYLHAKGKCVWVTVNYKNKTPSFFSWKLHNFVFLFYRYWNMADPNVTFSLHFMYCYPI